MDEQALLLYLLSGGQSMMNPMLQTPLQAGVGRTDIAPLLDDTGLGAVTGGINPAAIEQAMLEEVERQRRLYEAEENYKRAQIVGDIPQAPVYEQYFGGLIDQGMDILGAFQNDNAEAKFSSLATLVENGTLDPLEASAQMSAVVNDEGISDRYDMALVNNYFEGVKKTGEDFRKAESDYTAKFTAAVPLLETLGSQYDTDTGQWTHSWEPFSQQEAMRQYYDEAGVPNMAYMPSPSERFTPMYESSRTLEDMRGELERFLPEEQPAPLNPAFTGTESAATMARRLQQEHINKKLRREESNRKRDSEEMANFFASMGATPYNASLQSMLNFAVGGA